jgi:two-component system, NtrC family, response regulator HydG
MSARAVLTGAGLHQRTRVLVVDDDADMRDALATFLSDLGHECEVAADAATALGVIERMSLDAVLCDVRMNGMSGLELVDRLQHTHPALPVVVITAMGGVNDAVDAVKRGAFQYVTKPCDLDELRAIVAGAIRESQLHDRRSSFPPATSPSVELRGDSPAMRALQKCIDLVAASSAPVIIMGETGAGKELVARAIHARGPRRDKAFVAINTSAIPEDLLEGEIFGHVRGAFTGAVRSRRGLLTEADGGTLLLDEIGDMPFVLQAKLLRVLQFGEVRPVGSDRAHHVDVRVIASTHRNLPELVREGRFREDLYFRLNVLPVPVPPLRDHKEDIPALATHFLGEACQRAPHSPVRSIGAEELRALTEAPWPGNVRELATVIERAVVFGTHEKLATQGLPSASRTPAVAPAPPWSFRSDSPQTLRHLSRAYTDWVLAQTDGNKERAAQILGVDLSTLYRWRRTSPDWCLPFVSFRSVRIFRKARPRSLLVAPPAPTCPEWRAS